jgi:hypothetical protein
MTRLSVRVMLVLVCLGAMGSAAFLVWSWEQQARLISSSARQFDATARVTSVGVSELRSAQQAYVAVGQGEDFWFARVSAIVQDLDDRLGRLKSLASAPDATTGMDDAAGALQDFEQMDKRARDYARGHQLTAASDLIFTDGFDLTKKAGDAIEHAVTAELVARDAVVEGLRRKEMYALAGAAQVVAITLGLLLLPARRTREDVSGVASVAPAPTVSSETLEDLYDFGVAAAPAVQVAPPRSVDIGGMASLCVDLARLQDTRALPALLERAAAILGASGIVVWIADPDGRELSPILVHGYPPHMATRLGTLMRDAENVTASAYRTGLLQTVNGDAVSNGAVAAPLVGAGGCVGVMAAELKNGGEQQESLLAAATIIASQLATLVGPPPVRNKAGAAG